MSPESRYPVTVRVAWATGEAMEFAVTEDESLRVAQVLRFIAARRKRLAGKQVRRSAASPPTASPRALPK